MIRRSLLLCLCAAWAWHVPQAALAQGGAGHRDCEPPVIHAVIDNSPICPGGAIELSVAASGDIIGYSWEGPGTPTFFTATPAFTFNWGGPGGYTVIAYGFCGNDTALAIIAAEGAGAGQNNTVMLCGGGGSPIDLSLSLGFHDPFGAWTYNGEPHGSLYTPGVDTPGVYIYSVSYEPVCPGTSQSAAITVVETFLGPSKTITVCGGDSAFSLLQVLDSGAATGGSWFRYQFLDQLPHDSLYNPAVDSSGTFGYVLHGCHTTVTVVEEPLLPWYADADGDGYGDPLDVRWSCVHPDGYVADSTDTCPQLFGRIGDPCDDGLPGTVDDVITADCVCEGVLPTAITARAGSGLQLLAWPNPVEGRQLFIEVAATGPAEVRVMDASGRLVAGFSLALDGAAQVLNLPEMPKGLYLLRVVAGQRTGALPLVVQ